MPRHYVRTVTQTWVGERVLIAAMVFSIMFSFLHPREAFANLYSWTDGGGVMHVTDTLDKIPPDFRGRAVLLNSTPATPAQPQTDDRGDYILAFDKTPSRAIFVDVILNHTVRARMILDTGAGLVVLSEDLARRLNLETDHDSKPLVLHTAGGDVKGRSVTLTSVSLGALSKDQVQAAVNNAPNVFKGFDGLLGMSFLQDFKVVIDYTNNQIRLKRNCTTGRCEEP